MWLWLFYIATAVASYLLYRNSRPKAPPPGEVAPPEVPAGAVIPVAFGQVKIEPVLVDFGDITNGQHIMWPEQSTCYGVRWTGLLAWGFLDYIDVLYDEKRKLSDQGTQLFFNVHENTNAFFALDHHPVVDSATMSAMYYGGFPGTLNPGYRYAEIFLPGIFGGPPPNGEGGIELYPAGPLSGPLSLDCQGGRIPYGASYIFYSGGDTATETYLDVPPIDDLSNYGDFPRDGSCVAVPTTSGTGRIAYERFAYVHFKGAIGASPVLKKQEFICRAGPGAFEAFDGGYDTSPASLLYHILTDPDWGLGLSPALINFSSFSSAATQLVSTEGFGISGVMREQKPAEDYINEILRTIDGVLYRHPTTGLLELKLIRGDYTLGDLTRFDESNTEDLEWTWRELPDTVNEVVIAFTDRNSLYNRNVVTLQDHANIHTTGEVRTQTLEFPWISTETWALKVGARELKAGSLRIGRGTIRVTRAGWGFVPGDPIKVSCAKYGLSNVPCRILSANYGELDKGIIEFEIVQDLYGLPDVPYTVVDTDADDPAATPVGGPLITVTENNDGTYGQVVLTIVPNDAVTTVEFTTQSGSDTAVGPTTVSESPAYTYLGPQVLIDPTLGSTIAWSVTHTQGGLDFTRTGVSKFRTNAAATSGANSSVIVNNGTGFDFVYDQSSGDQIIVRT